jgi:hypothetical protein
MRSKNVRKEDIEAGIGLLERQIEGARHLLKQRPVNKKSLVAWSEETRSCLVKIYGSGSPNVRSLETTVGATPVWMGMPPEVAEKYRASRLERSMSMLESCIVSLKRKTGNSGRT